MEGLQAFLTASPALNYDKRGRAYLRLEWGRKTWQRAADGSYTATGAQYGTAMYRGGDAEEMFRRLRKGDVIVAAGQTETFTYTSKDGQERTKEIFTARALGHDASRTSYAVYRGPRVLAEEWGRTQQLVSEDFQQRAARLGPDLGELDTTGRQMPSGLAESGTATQTREAVGRGPGRRSPIPGGPAPAPSPPGHRIPPTTPPRGVLVKTGATVTQRLRRCWRGPRRRPGSARRSRACETKPATP